MTTKTKKKTKKTTLAKKPKAPQVELAKVAPGVKLTPMESALVGGDLALLSQEQRYNYYLDVCRSLKLNPLTVPFGYISIDGKMTLYARKDCAEQLRKIHEVSITDLKRTIDKDMKMIFVDVKGRDKFGKVDAATGVLEMEPYGKPLIGKALANEIMKCETKAKRRLTLSICGLSMPDETEILTIQDAKVIEVAEADTTKRLKEDAKTLPEAKPAKMPTASADMPMDKIVHNFPEELKANLKLAGFNTLMTAYQAYKSVEGDMDALDQLCLEKIKQGSKV